MSYTVTWKLQVKERLAEIWMHTPSRRLVTLAANRIDELLRTSPLSQGESRTGTERILIVSPLAIVYEVSDDDRRVDVLAIRQLPTEPQADE